MTTRSHNPNKPHIQICDFESIHAGSDYTVDENKKRDTYITTQQAILPVMSMLLCPHELDRYMHQTTLSRASLKGVLMQHVHAIMHVL